MNSIVQKWGNSLAFRIPNAFAKEAHLEQGTAVDVTLTEGKIIIAPRDEKKYSLTQMLKKITKKNQPREDDWGAPVGNEVW